MVEWSGVEQLLGHQILQISVEFIRHLLFSRSIIVYQLWWVSGSGGCPGVRWYSDLSLGIEGGVTAMYIAVLTHSQQGVNDW